MQTLNPVGELVKRMTSANENITLNGTDQDDVLVTFGGDDTLLGQGGNDHLNAGAGKDNLLGADPATFGANEQDSLSGGSGSDRFILGDNIHAFYASAGDQDFAIVEDFTGHGVGRNLHEEPAVFNYRTRSIPKVKLRAGMVLAIEPILNAGKKTTKILSDRWTAVTTDRSLSAQWEHTVLVTKDGYEILTDRTKV